MTSPTQRRPQKASNRTSPSDPDLALEYAYAKIEEDELDRELKQRDGPILDEKEQAYYAGVEAQLEQVRRHRQVLEAQLEQDRTRREMLEHKINVGSGRLVVIYGPMFGGKTDELIRQINRERSIRSKVVQVFKHTLDDRYDKDGKVTVSSHDGQSVKAIPVSKAKDILAELTDETTTVAIDEVQFFDRDIVQVCESLADRGIHVIVAGLTLDFRGELFGSTHELIARADNAIPRSANCQICEGPAMRSQRLLNGQPAHYDDSIIKPGADELYQARCRHCHEVPGKPEEV